MKIWKQDLEKWLVEYAVQSRINRRIVRTGKDSAREFMERKLKECSQK